MAVPSPSSAYSNSGSPWLRIASGRMMQRLMSGLDGISNIVLRSTSSMIDFRARAPVPRPTAFWAIASREPFSNTSSTLSRLKNFWYCLTSAFLGSVRIRTMSDSSSGCSVTVIGSRPMNSGMNPYLSRSSGWRSERISAFSRFADEGRNDHRHANASPP